MDAIVGETAVRRQNVEYLFKIANMVSTSCPPASRFYLSDLERRLQEFPDLLKDSAKKLCPHCGSLWDYSNNCRVRIHPRPRLNRHIKKLLKIEAAEPWKLNNRQKQKLKKFRSSTSKLVYRCFICNKTVNYCSGTKIKKTPSNTSTPVQKIKIKKGDLNAGLYIASPSNEKNNLEKSQISGKTKLLEENLNTSTDSLNTLNSSRESKDTSFKNEITPGKAKVFLESSSQKQSTGKRKGTLLAEILSQEQSKKKKASLSSFLVSL